MNMAIDETIETNIKPKSGATSVSADTEESFFWNSFKAVSGSAQGQEAETAKDIVKAKRFNIDADVTCIEGESAKSGLKLAFYKKSHTDDRDYLVSAGFKMDKAISAPAIELKRF